jgi:pimeloyl-ACP methyl ester carboxylesterase
VHLLDTKIDLSTHVADVVNVIEWEGLIGIVLCGHSYGGLVISGVAEQMPNAIASMVFVDAFVPENGDSVAMAGSPAIRERIGEAVSTGAATVPPVRAAIFRVNEKDRAWVDGLCTPQPLATLTQKLVLTGARERIAKKALRPRQGLPVALLRCRTGEGKRPTRVARVQLGLRP